MTFGYIPPPKLEHLSPQALASISDDVIEHALICYVADVLENAEDELEALSELPEALQAWYFAFLLDAEVLNGGFNQYFFNPSGQFAEVTPAALERMALPEAATLVARAVDLLETHTPSLEAAQQDGTIEAFMQTYIDQPFEELDNEYCSKEAEWRDARIAFLRRSAEEIRHTC